MRRIWACLAVCAAALLPAATHAEDSLAAQVASVVGRCLKAQTEHDFSGWLATYHPDSSFRRFILEGQKVWEGQQANPAGPQPPEFRFAMKSCAVLGSDNDYVVARVKEEKELTRQMKPSLPKFPYRLMTSDGLYVFRRHEGVWLIWTTKALSGENDVIKDAEQHIGRYSSPTDGSPKPAR
jgi:hypothetical protein